MSIKKAEAGHNTWAEFRKQRDSFRWPGGRHVAVVVNVAYETWSDGKAPGIGPMGNPLPSGAFDSNARSWGNYARFQGIDRILRILDRMKVRASVMVSGILAERLPDNVRAVVSAGHEIIAHSYAQDVVPATLNAEEDKANVQRTTKLLEQVTGTRPRGWASPRSTPSEQTIKSLIDEGYRWHSEVLDADSPYEQEFDNGKIVAIPFSMDINDLPHAMRYGRTPRQYVEMADDFLRHALASEDGAIIMDVTAHPHCYGRPGTAWAYEEVVKKVAARDDVWLATRAEIVEHYLKSR
jgi:peptidoglycan/xylan/chitin deacetylase (PgdA/CDA1 family)